MYDVIIIGSGPAGYVAAIRAGQTGLKTLIIDEKYVGGMCLNWGCIPTKSILHSAKLLRKLQSIKSFGIVSDHEVEYSFDWPTVVKRTQGIISKLSKGIEYLWKKNAVEFVKGRATIKSEHIVEVEKQIFETKKILIATGSKPAKIDMFKQEQIISLEDIYALDVLPQNPLIYGCGAIAIEMAQFFSMIGKKPTILATTYPILNIENEFLNKQVDKMLKKEKISVLKHDQVQLKDNMIIADEKSFEYDFVINCSHRTAVLPEIRASVTIKDGFISVNEYLQSSIPDIYAVGDVNGLSVLAHSASAQGNAAIDHINGNAEAIDLSRHPLNIYTEPELAHIGETEESLKKQGIDFKVKEFSFAANGKAMIEGSNEGSLRMLYETKYNQVLGVQIIGENATDMISEAAVLMELEGTTFDVAKAIHAHPTIAEVFMDASMAEPK